MLEGDRGITKEWEEELLTKILSGKVFISAGKEISGKNKYLY